MTTYKGYEIKQYGDAFFIMLNGERINTVRGTLSCAKHCIDSDYEDMTVVSQNLIENKQDLYLDPDFTVEGSDFVFKAHDDDKKDYIVRVAFDDLAPCLEVPSEDITKISISNTDNQQIVEACQTIVDGYQAGTTSYKVKIKLADGSITRIQAIELLKAAPSDEKYTIEINDAFNGDGTAKTILKWFSIGCLRAVWDDDLVLLEKKESKAPKIPTFEEAAERQKKSASYWKTWDEEYGETMHYTEEEKDLIQKLNN